ncbi:hypothetical protein K435DRAFT_791784 [Dendrothele bispora CBS 962.96]|uniref:FAD/NAD(P)-binding domain-containing protein n=1 Tax=Dendrothele bispora (strain CBS 962.96) TaxID=1314807 RepID=A0A4S8MKS6_DENBC|nr:hypothetical protein K435DRAFT_791784 [Dendrothele bispora CBS 962.96]
MTEASSSTTAILHGAWPLGDPFNSNGNSNSRTIIPIGTASETTYLDEVVKYGSSSTASASHGSSSTQATITTSTSTTCTNSRLEEKHIMMALQAMEVQRYTGHASRGSGSNASYHAHQRRLGLRNPTLCQFQRRGWWSDRVSCSLDPPNFNSNSGPDLDLHPQCGQLGHSIITHMISSIQTTTTSTSFSAKTFSGSNVDFFESSALQRGPSYYTDSLFSQSLRSTPKFSFPTLFNPRPGNHDTTTGLTMSPLSNKKVDESSKVHFQAVFIRSQPTIYLVQANLKSVLFEGLMGNGFTAGGQHGATVNGQEDEEFETANTVIVAPGASAKEVGIERQRGVIGKAGLVLVRFLTGPFQFSGTKPLAVIGGGDSAAKEAPYYPPEHHSYRMSGQQRAVEEPLGLGTFSRARRKI